MLELGLLPAEVLATQGVGVLSCSLGVSANTTNGYLSHGEGKISAGHVSSR